MAMEAFAMKVEETRGRRFAEVRHPYRNEYARDRDRVIHARAFRRLEGKTQVFTLRYSDHFRNRLTHTLEVTQIARTVAGALGVNADLAEALALVHDIGHPPFGHAGERRLDGLLKPYGDGFDHNLHALRIVEKFEQRYLDFPGLNLTFEVREGIIKHSRDYDAKRFPELAEYLLEVRPPVEAQLIDWVDEIAYNTADLDDAVEAELVSVEEICNGVPAFGEVYAEVERRHPRGREKLKFSAAVRRVLDILATDLVDETRRRVRDAGVQSVDDVRGHGERLAAFSEAGTRWNAALKEFLRGSLYDNAAIAEERERSCDALEELFHFYMSAPEAMPPFHTELAKREPRQRVVSDYIAGMTDRFLLRQHAEAFAAMKKG